MKDMTLGDIIKEFNLGEKICSESEVLDKLIEATDNPYTIKIYQAVLAPPDAYFGYVYYRGNANYMLFSAAYNVKNLNVYQKTFHEYKWYLRDSIEKDISVLYDIPYSTNNRYKNPKLLHKTILLKTPLKSCQRLNWINLQILVVKETIKDKLYVETFEKVVPVKTIMENLFEENRQQILSTKGFSSINETYTLEKPIPQDIILRLKTQIIMEEL